MVFRNGVGLASAPTDNEAPKIARKYDKRSSKPSPNETQPPIRSELRGSNVASALGFSASGAAPVLALCRELVAAGHHPATPLEGWRGEVLALRVAPIGEGAALTVDEHNGTRFAKWKPFCRSAVSPRIARGRRGPHE
jgi:hypothetical protein